MKSQGLKILKRGDAVLLTSEATASVLGLPLGSETDQQLAGMILDELDPWEDVGSVRGVVVNGQAHQMIESEFETVLSGEVGRES